MPWVRVAAAALLLVGLAFVQDPGYLIADTKLDLSVDPGGFLARAGHLWDADGAFGQLQNQAYGYLWPMGPFFWLGHTSGLDPWVVQRLWIALVLVVAFIGATAVTRSLGVRSDFACLLAGFAYAASPRMVSIVGGVSIEAWPSAVAPWVLLPLVIGAARGSPRRAAALSALAVGMVGGVNAVATAAVLPLGALWLLTRSPGSRRRSMMLWWPMFTFLATCWWLVPLFVMGAYSPPFLDFIESASVTTFPNTLVNAMRGTSAWIPYVDGGWRAGSDLLRLFVMPLNSGILLLLGVVGIGRTGNPHRFFCALSLVVGMLLITFGHTGVVQGWWAPDAQTLLDGPLAAMRNVHKFDPVVRLPLVIGLAWAVQGMWESRAGAAPEPDPGVPAWLARASWRSPVVVTTGLAMLAVLVGAMPLLQSRIPRAAAPTELPQYWQATADWLDQNAQDGVALLAPGSGFGNYLWGETGDEPLQALASSPWAVRNAIPLTPPGNIRMLDAVEARLANGKPSPGLAAYLRRAGVTHVVVRNDLQRQADVPDSVLVHRVLRDSPGFTRVATFGPDVGGGATLEVDDSRVVVNGGWQGTYPAVEVYGVGGGDIGIVGTDDPPTIVGGPEDLLDLIDLGLLGAEPSTLAVDTPTDQPLSGPLILTDGLLARERFFGRVHDSASAVLTGAEPRRSGNPTRDYRLEDDEDRWSTRARLEGAAEVSAQSSMSDAGNPGGTEPGFHPQAAVDGRRYTSWRSGSGERDSWWQIDFSEPRDLPFIRVTAGSLAPESQRLRVVTDAGRSEAFQLRPRQSRRVRIPGATRRVRVVDAGSLGEQQLDLAEVRMPGVRTQRSLVTPEVPAAWGAPDLIVLRRLGERRTGCLTVDGEVRCNQRAVPAPPEQPGALRRVVRLPQDRDFPARIIVTADPRRAEDIVQLGKLAQARSSSTSFNDVRSSGVAAIDGEPATTWIANRDDVAPTLDLNWVGMRQIRGLEVRLSRSAAASRPTRLRISWPVRGGRQTREVVLDRRGRARFPAVRADRMSIQVLADEDAVDLGFDSIPRTLPVGISELRLTGADVFPSYVTDDPLPLGCGSGPSLVVNGERRLTRVVTSAAAVMRDDPAPALLCGEGDRVRLREGENTIRLPGGRRFFADSVVLGAVPEVTTRSLTSSSEGPTRLAVQTPDAWRLLVGLPFNANPGWTVRRNGEPLPVQVVDGWRQGWWSPSGGGSAQVSFTPDGEYRGGLIGGALLAVVLLGLVLTSRRWSDRGDDVTTERRPSERLLAAAGALIAGLLAGWLGAALALITALAILLAPPRLRPAGLWLGGSLVFLATLAYAFRTWGGATGWAGDLAWPDYVILVPLIGVLILSGRRGR